MDCEIAERPEDKTLSRRLNICFRPQNVKEEDWKKAQAYIEGASSTKLDEKALFAGLSLLVGAAVATAILASESLTSTAELTSSWLSKMIKNTKKQGERINKGGKYGR